MRKKNESNPTLVFLIILYKVSRYLFFSALISLVNNKTGIIHLQIINNIFLHCIFILCHLVFAFKSFACNIYLYVYMLVEEAILHDLYKIRNIDLNNLTISFIFHISQNKCLFISFTIWTQSFLKRLQSQNKWDD